MNLTKILIITSEFPPQPGGIGNHAYNLALSLHQFGMKVRVVSENRSGDGKEEQAFDLGQPFSICRIAKGRSNIATYFRRLKVAYQQAGEQEIVLLSGKFSLWTGGLLRLCMRRKFAAVVHGSELKLPNLGLRKLTESCLKQFDGVIAVSHYTHSLLSHLKLKRSHVIFNGFEKGVTPPRVQEIEGPLQLITVGNVTPRKGQHQVIKALPMLKQKFPGIVYHVVGIPTDQHTLSQLAKELRVEDAVVFHGRVDEATKTALVRQAHIFVMLSEQTKTGDVEGFGIAILEANALGLPAIGTKNCGIEDAVKDGYSGKLITPGAMPELVQRMEEICGNYGVYSKNAVQWSEAFGWEHIGKQYLSVLQEL